MPLPIPEPGLVIDYKFLWAHEHDAGEEEGEKARPCIIVATEKLGHETLVTVVPITHSPPRANDAAVELPRRVKAHLGLDAQQSWVIVDELNQFFWPGRFNYPVARGRPGQWITGLFRPRCSTRSRPASRLWMSS